MSSPIPWTRHLSSAYASVFIVVVFVRIFLRLRLHLRRCHRFGGPVIEPLPPLPLSLIPRTRCLFLVLRRRLRRRHWVLGTVCLRQRHRRCRQFPGPINTSLPLPSETFSWERRLFCFLCRHLRRHRWVLGLIFLWQRLRRCCQFLSPVIATMQPPSSSLNPCRLCRRLWSLRRVVYSLSSSKASVVVVDSTGQSLKEYLLLGCWLRIFSGDGFHLWLLGALVYITLFCIDTVENSWGVNLISRDFMRNIQSFGSRKIYVVCNIYETGTIDLKLATKWNANYLGVVDFVFFLVAVCTCDCWLS